MIKRLLIFNISLIIIISISCKKEKYYVDSPTAYDNEILTAINVNRQSIGLKPLVHDSTLWSVANKHSEDMANGVVPFGHEGITQRSDQIMLALGNGQYAENVATGTGTAEEIVNSWLANTGFKINIEGNFTLTGISAVKIKNGTYYYTEIFYKKNP